jgi:hypothetical protein
VVEHQGNAYRLESILLSLGVDCTLTRADRPLPEHPRGFASSLVDLDDMLRSHRVGVSDGPCWRATVLLVPSIAYYSGGRIRRPIGVMFDVGKGSSPHRSREGCAVACRWVAENPVLYLRSLAHEVGHLFNLTHPHEDEPPVYTGDTLMFETRQLSRSRRFPENVRLEFSEANRAWIRETPEGFVRPGGAPYGSRPGKTTTVTTPPTDRRGRSVDFVRSGSPASLEIEIANPDPLPGLPLELIVGLAACESSRRTWSADLDPAGGKLEVESRTEGGTWSALPSVIRDCGVADEPIPPGGVLRRVIVLPSPFPQHDRTYAVRVRYCASDPRLGADEITSNELIVRTRTPIGHAERSVCAASRDVDLRTAAFLRGFPRRFAAARRRLERLFREVDLVAVAPRLALTLAWDRLRSDSPRERRLAGRRILSAILKEPAADYLRAECETMIEGEHCTHRREKVAARSTRPEPSICAD